MTSILPHVFHNSAKPQLDFLILITSLIDQNNLSISLDSSNKINNHVSSIVLIAFYDLF